MGGTPGAEFPTRTLGAGEPNDVPARATAFATSVTGTLAAEGDIDWYRFDSTGQESVDVTVTPPTRDASIGQNADPILTVYDKDLRLIGKADRAGPGGAEALKFVGDTGTYYVSVSNYNGAADTRSYTLAVAAGSTASLFQLAVSTDVGAQARTVDVADVTGDSRDDVLLMTSGYTGSENDDKLFVFAQRPDGTLAPPVRYGTDAVAKAFFMVLDTNGDGRQDVAINVVGGINVLRQTASGTLESAGLLPGTGIPVAGDMDGDGDSDLVAAGDSGITLLTQGDGGTFTATPISNDAGGEVEVGDVDGDGKLEVVSAPPPYLGNAPIRVYHATGTGWTRTDHATGMTSPETISGIEVADVSGDGRADIVTTFGGNKPSSQVSVLVQNATGGLDNGLLYPVWDVPEPVEAADVTGDSRLDVVVVHGAWHALSVLPQTGDGRLGAPIKIDDLPYATSYTVQGLALGDINGDNRTDAVIADYNNGLVVLRNNNGPTRGGPQCGCGMSRRLISLRMWRRLRCRR
jgi:hypothetical protein